MNRLSILIVSIFLLTVSTGAISQPLDILVTERAKLKLGSRFDGISDCSEGFCTAIKNGLYTFVDTNGRELLPFQFEQVNSFRNGYAVVIADGHARVIDRNGKDAFAQRKDLVYIGDMQDGSFFARDTRGKCGFINLQGETVIPFVYDDINTEGFRHGVAIVTKGLRMGLIDKKNAAVAPAVYDFIHSFEEQSSVTPVRQGKRWGILAADGTLRHAVNMTYGDVGAFSNGYAVVERGGLKGYLDTGAKLALPLRWENTGGFNQWGLAEVSHKGERYLIDISGNPVLKDGYWQVSQTAADHFIVSSEEGREMRVVSREGKQLWPATYSSIIPMGQGLFLVRERGKTAQYYADANGGFVANASAQE